MTDQSAMQDPAAEVPPRDPLAGNSAADDSFEVEARDKLGLRLILAAESMASAVMASRGASDADGAEKYAQAAHKLTQAVVLITPIAAADDIAGQGGSVPGAGLSRQRERVDQ